MIVNNTAQHSKRPSFLGGACGLTRSPFWQGQLKRPCGSHFLKRLPWEKMADSCSKSGDCLHGVPRKRWCVAVGCGVGKAKVRANTRLICLQPPWALVRKLQLFIEFGAFSTLKLLRSRKTALEASLGRIMHFV